MELSRRIEIYDVAIPNKAHRVELKEEAILLENKIKSVLLGRFEVSVEAVSKIKKAVLLPCSRLRLFM